MFAELPRKKKERGGKSVQSVQVQINGRYAWEIDPNNFRNMQERVHKGLRLAPDVTGRYNQDLGLYHLVFCIYKNTNQ